MTWLALCCSPCARKSSAWTTEQWRPCRQMQAQCGRPGLEAQVVGLQRLAIEVDVQPLRALDLDPGQPGPDEQAVTGQQLTQGSYHLLRCWQDGDVEQAVVHH